MYWISAIALGSGPVVVLVVVALVVLVWVGVKAVLWFQLKKVAAKTDGRSGDS